MTPEEREHLYDDKIHYDHVAGRILSAEVEWLRYEKQARCGECGSTHDCSVCRSCGYIGDANGDADCENCEGSGTITQMVAIITTPHNAVFEREYLRKIIRLPGWRIFTSEQYAPARFTFDGGEGVLMPQRHPNPSKLIEEQWRNVAVASAVS